MENQELLTVEEMAARLKVPPSWLYSRTRIRGTEAMPGVLRCGKYLRFSPETVLSWIKTKYGENRG
jgi:hypothetical protein